MFAAILPSEPLALEGAACSAETGLQRSFGSAELVIAAGGVKRAYQDGSAKLRFPKKRKGEATEAVLINLSGGLTGGDTFSIAATLEDGARASLTSQACERIYRSLGSDARIAVSATLGSGAVFDYLPQSTILFDGARLRRETRFELAEDARLLAVEAIVFGRTESGERMETGAISDSCFIRRGGRLVHADRLFLTGDIHRQAAQPATLDGRTALAALRYVAPDAEARLEELRAALEDAKGFSAASAWDGMLIARFLAQDGYTLNHDLGLAVALLRTNGSPRMWAL